MKTLSTEERGALRDSVHRLFSEKSTEAAVRATMDTDSGYDQALWRQLGDLGVIGLIIDENLGGSGAGPLELEAVMEEAGAVLLCSPLLASGVLAAQLLVELGDSKVSERLLPKITTGEVIATAVLTGKSGCWTDTGVTVNASVENDAWQLNGAGSYLLHGQNADVLVVVAKQGANLMAFEVAADAQGVSIEAMPTFDHTSRLASVSFKQVSAQPIESTVPVWDAVQGAIDLALVALAGEQAGGAQKVLDITVEYAKTRIQFGRQIGSFQAVKHMAADLLLETESAISAARDAAVSLANRTARQDQAVSLAAFTCADAFVKTAADGIQMHGGIAFTWEHPAHLYLKRARADAYLFGSPAQFRERYLTALGG